MKCTRISLTYDFDVFSFIKQQILHLEVSTSTRRRRHIWSEQENVVWHAL